MKSENCETSTRCVRPYFFSRITGSLRLRETAASELFVSGRLMKLPSSGKQLSVILCNRAHFALGWTACVRSCATMKSESCETQRLTR